MSIQVEETRRRGSEGSLAERIRLHLIHGQAIDLKVSVSVDVQPGEALEVWDPQGRECFIIVDMEPVDSYVQVTAKKEPNCWGG